MAMLRRRLFSALQRQCSKRKATLHSIRFHSATPRSNLNPTLRATRRNTAGKLGRRSWSESLQALSDYKSKHGNCHVPQRYRNDRPLGTWVMIQRMNKEKLKVEQKDMLDAIGFDWETREEKEHRMWEEKFQKLVDFHKANGDCRVPQKYDADPPLGHWVSCQRQMEKDNRILPERKTLLNSLGFTWSTRKETVQFIHKTNQKRWDAQFEKLVEFEKEWGHCIVPQQYDEDVSFARWLDTQRFRALHGKILPERKKLLDELGFVWEKDSDDNNLHAKRWNVMFDRLLDYRDAHGDVQVPYSFSKDGLGNWVALQRIRRKQQLLDPLKEARLKEIGFTWKAPPSWLDRFRQMQDFQKEHGHCHVPRSFSSPLWGWIKLQRRRQKAGELKADQIKKLKSIGFDFNPPRGRRVASKEVEQSVT